MTLLPFLLLSCSDSDLDTSSKDETDSGPSGPSVMVNDCGPDDGGIYKLTIGIESDASDAECTVNQSEDWSVVITIQDPDIVSGVEISIAQGDIMGNYADFYDGEAHRITEGTVTLTFDGDWNSGIEYTGTYWLDSPEISPIQGTFTGSLCTSDLMCG